MKLDKLLPKKINKKLLQSKIREDIFNRVKSTAKKNGIKYSVFIEAALTHFCDIAEKKSKA
jgi:hypothetical protein